MYNIGSTDAHPRQCEIAISDHYPTTEKLSLIQRSMPFESSCLRIVIECKVADVLDAFPDGLHVSEIAKKVNVEKGKLARILRLLATRNCFREGRISCSSLFIMR